MDTIECCIPNKSVPQNSISVATYVFFFYSVSFFIFVRKYKYMIILRNR